MKQQVIDRFNRGTTADETAFVSAQAASFPVFYFLNRAEAKARASGILPNAGCLVYEARYTKSAERVVNEVMDVTASIGAAQTLAGPCVPWLDSDMRQWKNVLCSISCAAFNAGVVAAMTWVPKGAEDPILKNGGLAIFGDVGFMGLRQKVVNTVHAVGGEQWIRIMGEVGDCACLHLFADQRNSERVFKMETKLREAYVRNASQAAYLAGSAFGEYVMEQAHRQNTGR